MSSKSAASVDDTKGQGLPTATAATDPSIRHGQLDAVLGDKENSDFYGSSVTDTYRLKSELVALHLGQIGMGK